MVQELPVAENINVDDGLSRDVLPVIHNCYLFIFEL